MSKTSKKSSKSLARAVTQSEHHDIVKDYFTMPDYFGKKAGACHILFSSRKTGEYMWLPNNGCHANMASFGNRYDSCYTSLWCRNEAEYDDAIAYWNYLIDPNESPFRLALKNGVVIRDDLSRPIAFGYEDTDVPAQVAVALFMQLRVPQEHTHKLRSFAWWKKCGFKNYEALWLSEHLKLQYNGLLASLEKKQYRHAFEPSNKTTQFDYEKLAGYGIDIRKLRDGITMDNKHLRAANKLGGSSFTEYRPIHPLWKLESGWSITELNQHLAGDVTYSGTMPELFKLYNNGSLTTKGAGFVSKEDAAKILMKHRSEWSC